MSFIHPTTAGFAGNNPFWFKSVDCGVYRRNHTGMVNAPTLYGGKLLLGIIRMAGFYDRFYSHRFIICINSNYHYSVVHWYKHKSLKE